MTKRLGHWWHNHRAAVIKKTLAVTASVVAITLTLICVLALDAHEVTLKAARQSDIHQYTTLLQTFHDAQAQATPEKAAVTSYIAAHGADTALYTGGVLAQYVTLRAVEQRDVDREIKAAIAYNALADRPRDEYQPRYSPPDDMPQHLTPDVP